MTEPLRAAREPSDLAHGMFSSDPPWTLDDPTSLPWRRGLGGPHGVRAMTRAEVPELVRPSRMPPGSRLVRTAALLGWALGAWAARERRGHGDGAAGRSRSIAGLSRRLRMAAERLGPTYIKLGQIISAGEGIFPEELVAEFKKCRDQVPPEPWDAVRAVVEDDLGRPLRDVFSSFDTRPVAAASIAQVHAARLVTGEDVVVKVQRPSVARLVRQDLRVMAWLAPHLVGRIPVAALANPPALVELFAETIAEELDFRLEAENMLDIARSGARLGQRSFVVPRPHPVLVTPRVLVMERLHGFAFDDVVGMKHAGVDTEEVVRNGMVGFMEGAMINGIFHGDLHGGNLLVLPDGRTGLLDYGITGRLDEARRLAFLRLLVGGTMNDVRAQLDALRDLGALPPDTDLDFVISDLGLDRPPIDPTQLSADELVHEIQRTIKALLGMGARLPKELMLFVKNLVFLDGAIATLAPDLDLFAEIAHIADHFTRRYGEQIAADVGLDPHAWQLDLTGVKASFGVDPESTSSLTYRDLQERRAVIRSRLEARQADAPRRLKLPFRK
jgi:ubiquinone biosynthesis protein